MRKIIYALELFGLCLYTVVMVLTGAILVLRVENMYKSFIVIIALFCYFAYIKLFGIYQYVKEEGV